MPLKYFLPLCGILSFATFIAAKNNFLVNERISFIFSSEYIFYLSVFLIFMGYYLSTVHKKK